MGIWLEHGSIEEVPFGALSSESVLEFVRIVTSVPAGAGRSILLEDVIQNSWINHHNILSVGRVQFSVSFFLAALVPTTLDGSFR